MTKQLYAVFDTNVLVSAFGNLRHFPKMPIVVSPTDMISIIEGNLPKRPND